MAKKRKPTPMIDRLKDRGLSRSEILDRVNGPNNGNVLSRQQLNAIGFKDTFIENYLRAKTGGGSGGRANEPNLPFGMDWRPRGGGSGGAGSPSGDGGTGAPGDSASPDPLQSY